MPQPELSASSPATTAPASATVRTARPKRPAGVTARIAATAFASLLLCAGASAQSGVKAGKSASDLPTEPPLKWHKVNPEAWDSFRSGDTERMFGSSQEQEFTVKFDYMSEATLWGYRIGQSTFRPSFEWVGPLFGGESYTEVLAYMPVDNAYAKQLWIYGGWRYHLTPVLDVDIGGTFIFADKRLAGPGLPTEQGWRSRGTIYLGFVGRHWLTPSFYTVYDFELDQTELILGIKPEIELTKLGLPFEGFTLQGLAALGYFKGNRWKGEYGVEHSSSFQNNAAYWQLGTRLNYDFSGTLEGVSTHIGVTYSGNAGSSGGSPIPGGGNSGPKQQVSFTTGISYAF